MKRFPKGFLIYCLALVALVVFWFVWRVFNESHDYESHTTIVVRPEPK